MSTLQKDGEEGKDEDQGEEQKAKGSEAEARSAPALPPPAKKKSGKDSAKAAGVWPRPLRSLDHSGSIAQPHQSALSTLSSVGVETAGDPGRRDAAF